MQTVSLPAAGLDPHPPSATRKTMPSISPDRKLVGSPLPPLGLSAYQALRAEGQPEGHRRVREEEGAEPVAHPLPEGPAAGGGLWIRAKNTGQRILRVWSRGRFRPLSFSNYTPTGTLSIIVADSSSQLEAARREVSPPHPCAFLLIVRRGSENLKLN